MNKHKIPQKYLDLVGTKQLASGGLFSSTKSLEPMEYQVIDIRRGSARIINMKEFIELGESKTEHPTYELLLKRDGMKRAQWSKPFPITEINLKETECSMFL